MTRQLDAQARKRLVLARIALERLELRRDLAAVRRSTQVPELLRSLLGAALGTPTPSQGHRTTADWLRWGWRLVRRYKGAATLLAAAGPLLGRFRRVRHVLGAVASIGAAWVVWRATRTPRPQEGGDPRR